MACRVASFCSEVISDEARSIKIKSRLWLTWIQMKASTQRHQVPSVGSDSVTE